MTPGTTSVLSRRLPGLAVARGYQRRWLSRDLTAGLALTGILIPAGMAYAEASGLPASSGLYATVVALLAYALVGPSRFLVLGPDSSLVPLIVVAVAPFAAASPAVAVGYAATLALLVGALIGLAGLARLGFITDLLSAPMRVGFLGGVSIIILATQLPRLFGITVTGDTVLERLRSLLDAVLAGETNTVSLAIGLACIAVILASRRWSPRIPGALVAVVGATIVSSVLDLAARSGVVVVGPLPQGLPLPVVPSLAAGDIAMLLPAAFGIALVTAADTIILSRTFAARLGDDSDPDQELVALGAANLAVSIFGGFPVSSSASRTAVADDAGSRTQLTGVVGAAAVVALLVLAPGLLATLPEATLAAVVIVAAVGLADVGAFVRLWRLRPSEFAIALATFLGVVVLGVIQGIVLAVALALLAFLRRQWRPHDAVLGRAAGVKGYHDLTYYPDAKQIPGLVLYRFDAPLLFFNSDTFRGGVQEALGAALPPVHWVIVAAEPISDVDTTAADMLELLRTDLAARGIVLAFAELKDPVKDQLRRYGTLARVGEEHCFPTIGSAVAAYVARNQVAWVDPESEPPTPATPGT